VRADPIRTSGFEWTTGRHLDLIDPCPPCRPMLSPTPGLAPWHPFFRRPDQHLRNRLRRTRTTITIVGYVKLLPGQRPIAASSGHVPRKINVFAVAPRTQGRGHWATCA